MKIVFNLNIIAIFVLIILAPLPSICQEQAALIDGCTDVGACNYSPTATNDDGSCIDCGLVDVVTEVFYTDDGTVDGYPFGFTTYRIYAELCQPTDHLLSVIGANGNVLQIGSSTGTFWNSEHGGVVGEDLNPFLISIFPSSQYDSYVTIGRSNSGDQGNATNFFDLFNPSAFEDSFGTVPFGVDLSVSEGTWFTTTNGLNSLGIGPENRVLLAQITTNGELCYSLNIGVQTDDACLGPLVYMNGTGGLEDNQVDGSDLGLFYPNPSGCSNLPTETFGCTDQEACNFNPAATIDDGSCVSPDGCGECDESNIPGCLDADACNYNSAANCDDGSCCFDNCITLTLTDGNFPEEVSWELYSSDGFLITSGGVVESMNLCLPNDCYTFHMFDSFGDGWNGSTYSIYTQDGTLLQSGDLDSATLGDTETFGIDYIGIPDFTTNGCIIGCTDPLACNYDLNATYNDGSCDEICTCDSDFDSDGDTDSDDLLSFLSFYGCVSPNNCGQADFDNNGFVGSGDLLIFLVEFGTQCTGD